MGKNLEKQLSLHEVKKEVLQLINNVVTECECKKNLKILDLTGAGDLFAAGYLHGYINNLTIQESLEKGTEMSSKVIQQIGARLIYFFAYFLK